MKIKWLRKAIQDLEKIHQYIKADNPIAANKVAKQIVKAINMLEKHPGMGRLGRIHNTRELIISKTPYIVPYRVKNNYLEILRIIHAARKWNC